MRTQSAQKHMQSDRAVASVGQAELTSLTETELHNA